MQMNDCKKIAPRIRRFFSLSAAKSISRLLKFWRFDGFAYSPEEWRQMRISFADSAEDLIVYDLLKNIPSRQRGVYVDAGAFDPVLMSNTHLLSMLGWRGVNIDASPLNIEKFQRIRPQDINVCAGLSNTECEFLFLEYLGGTGSRLVSLGAEDERSLCGDKPIRSTRIKSRRLSDILQSALGSNPQIDFLSVDCEGFDWEVISTLDFSIHRPKVVCVESAWEDGGANRFYDFFQSKNYALHAKLPCNAIFVDRDFRS